MKDVTRTISESFPNTMKKEFRVGRQELLSSLQRVATLTADKLMGVRWNLTPGHLNVAANNADMEEAEDENLR